MKLSIRLDTIRKFVDSHDIVADIGCDHALLCCSLILDNHCTKAYACDINEGPLKQAEHNIHVYHLEDKVKTILCDGLDALPQDVNTIVVAGMGYDTVHHILETNKDKIQDKKMIIQINKDVYKLREYITSEGYKILQEKTIFEDNHYYEIVCFTCEEAETLSYGEIKYGKRMCIDETYISYIQYRLDKQENILACLPKDNDKYTSIAQEITYMKKLLEDIA